MDSGRTYFEDITKGIKGDDDNKVRVLKVVYASSVPYYLNLWLVKFALLGLYFRIVPRNTITRKFLWFTFVVAIMAGVVIVLLNLLLCQPVSLNWALHPTERCYSSTSETPFIVSVVVNLVVDICIFVIPFPVLKTLANLTRRQKIGLAATFSLGILTIIVLIVRAVIVATSGSVALTAIFTALECMTSMAVACLPSFRSFLKMRKTRRPLSKRTDEESIVSHTPRASQPAQMPSGTRQAPAVNEKSVSAVTGRPIGGAIGSAGVADGFSFREDDYYSDDGHSSIEFRADDEAGQFSFSSTGSRSATAPPQDPLPPIPRVPAVRDSESREAGSFIVPSRIEDDRVHSVI